MRLHDAASRGDTEAMKKQIEEGADPNEKDDEGLTPLHHAASRKGPTIEGVRTLVEGGANPNEELDSDGLTPLHLAAMNGDSEFIRILLERGANPNVMDHDRRTPLYLAACYAKEEVESEYPPGMVELIQRTAHSVWQLLKAEADSSVRETQANRP